MQCPAFRGISFRDGMGRDLSKSRDPGIFGTGLAQYFHPGFFLEIFRNFSGLTFLMEFVISFHKQLKILSESESIFGDELSKSGMTNKTIIMVFMLYKNPWLVNGKICRTIRVEPPLYDQLEGLHLTSDYDCIWPKINFGTKISLIQQNVSIDVCSITRYM